MIGSKLSKILNMEKTKKKAQVLLVTVMLLATVMTIVLSVTFQSVSETQISKLEEENQRALAAAEAALERALAENNTVILGQGSLGNFSGFTGQASIEETSTNNFTSPVVKKDDSYTFYLGNYNKETGLIGQAINQNIEICFQSASPNPAVEIALIKENSIKKYVYDPSLRINNATNPSSICSNNNFNYSITIPASDISTDGKVLVVRSFYNNTKFYFKSSVNLPVQGRRVVSQASTQTGVSKKIVLFQSNPQVPAGFFTTSF